MGLGFTLYSISAEDSNSLMLMSNPLARGVSFGDACNLDKAAWAIDALAYPDVEDRISQGLFFVPGFHAGDAELRVYSPGQVARLSREITPDNVSRNIRIVSDTLFVDQDVYPFADGKETPTSVRTYLVEWAGVLSGFLTNLAADDRGMFGVSA